MTITIEKALKTLQEILDDEESQWESDGQDALKLGIEALKNKLEARHYGVASSKVLLPGETSAT